LVSRTHFCTETETYIFYDIQGHNVLLKEPVCISVPSNSCKSRKTFKWNCKYERLLQHLSHALNSLTGSVQPFYTVLLSAKVIPSSIQSSLVIMKRGIDFFRSLKNTQIAIGIISLMTVFCKKNKWHIFSYFMKQQTLLSSPNDLKLQKHW